jgi:integrase
LGARAGNWLTRDQASLYWKRRTEKISVTFEIWRMISVLLGCGLRRAELSALKIEDIQIRQAHWAIVDLVGKCGHIRTVPTPIGVKQAVDRWMVAARSGQVGSFGPSAATECLWGKESPRMGIWYVVRRCAERMQLDHLAPHDLRRTCADLCHVNGGEIEQIQFLLGHASVLTTERISDASRILSRPPALSSTF